MSILEMAFRDELEYLQSLLDYSKKTNFIVLSKNIQQRIDKVNKKIQNINNQ